MKNKMLGSLLPERRHTSTAANDDGVAKPAVVKNLPELDRQGWDPFEVWRTRVKEARARTSLAPSLATRKS